MRWHARPDNASNPDGHPAGDYMIGDCENLPDNIAVCTSLAHARLIAAAPDLLEALRWVVEWYAYRHAGDDSISDDQTPKIASAIAAIAKATQP